MQTQHNKTKDNWKWPEIGSRGSQMLPDASCTQHKRSMTTVRSIPFSLPPKACSPLELTQLNLRQKLHSKAKLGLESAKDSATHGLQRKTSSFLINYGHKLKKQYRRQAKRKMESLNTSSLGSEEKLWSESNQAKSKWLLSCTQTPREKSPEILVMKKKPLLSTDVSEGQRVLTQKHFLQNFRIKALLSEIKKQEEDDSIQASSFYTMDKKTVPGSGPETVAPFRELVSKTTAHGGSWGNCGNFAKEQLQEPKKKRRLAKPASLDRHYNFSRLEPWEGGCKEHSIAFQSIEFSKILS